jgi:hypothetical protein
VPNEPLIDIPYNVMTAAAIKAAAHDGIKNFFDLLKDANRQLHSSEIGKMANEVNSYSAKINDTIGKSKNVLNSEKFSTKMKKKYQKVVSGPVSKAVNSEAYSTFDEREWESKVYMTVLTDKYGNLVTTTPGVIK